MSSTLRQPAPPAAYTLSRDRGPLDHLAIAPSTGPRRRGRPPLATPEQVLAEIREVAAAGALFRIHIDRPALYARARRLWGSWSGALAAAGLDYEVTMTESRRRALDTRRQRLESRKSGSL